jgi:adenylate cyclase
MRKLVPFVAILLLALLAGEFVYQLDPFGLEEKTVDMRFRLRGPLSVAHSDLILITIDNTSYKDLPDRWPFPRSYYAHAVENLRQAGVKLIVFDIQFTEPDLEDPAQDSALVASMLPEGTTQMLRSDVIHAGQLVTEIRSGAVYRRLDKPLPGLVATADWGLINDLVDGDGYLRRYQLFQPLLRDTLITGSDGSVRREKLSRQHPSLGMVLMKRLLELPDSAVFIPDGHVTHFGPLDIPTYRGLQNVFPINYYGPASTFPTYSFSSILDDAGFDLLEENDTDYMELFQDKELFSLLAPDSENPFEGKIALIGVSIEDLHDNKLTPFYSYAGQHNLMPGVETHAHAIQTIIDGSFLVSPPRYYSQLLQLILLALILFLVRRFSPLFALGLVSPVIIAAILIPVVLFGLMNINTNMTAPLAALVTGYLAAGIYQLVLERRNRLQIHNMFSHYVPTSLVKKLIEQPELLKLGGEEKELTVLFTDIAGFTTVSEQLEPSLLARLLNEYLTAMSDIIMANRGTIDKYEGDLIMAEFGAPVHFADHAAAACQAALQMQAGLQHLCLDFEKRGLPGFEARIGLNTGRMVVGNMGSDRIFDYTVIGDAVNLASRLEGINKAYGTSLLISEFTAAAVGDRFLLRELDLVRVKGKKLPITIFELSGERSNAEPELLEKVEEWEQLRAVYLARDWSGGVAACEAYLQRWPDDPVPAVFRERCLKMVDSPPPLDWDGVFDFLEKL